MDSQSSPPRIAIGMPVYNGERYLEETLETVFNQTYSDFTLIISDNASTDRTEEICRDYASKHPRTNYIRNPVNLGASQNYKRCFDPAQSEYFRWQNADDPIEPTLLERCKKVLDEFPDVVLAYGKSKIIDEHGAFTEDYDDNLDLPQDRALDRFVAFTSNIGLQNLMYGLIRRNQLAKTALLGNYVASDTNLIGELTLYGKFKEIPVHLFNRRMHPQASSWNRKDIEVQREFWDPSMRKLVMQTWRRNYEYCRAVLKAPIPIKDKGILSYYQLKRAYWQRKPMKNELVDLIKFGLLKRS
jgi:glycosyltransferase involved in cell wall biosynthesis